MSLSLHLSPHIMDKQATSNEQRARHSLVLAVTLALALAPARAPNSGGGLP